MKTLSFSEKNLLTDIEAVLKFIEFFVGKKRKALKYLGRAIAENTGIVDGRGTDIFSKNFGPLRLAELFGNTLTAEEVYSDVLHLVFNTDLVSDSLRLNIVNIRAQGELGLKIGAEGGFFGVINIGDTSALIKQCAEKGIVTSDDEFSNFSLFRNINDANSSIKMLIGSRKFTEGWNCWRVSTMGLINFAKGEGSQAIQLFGCGIRLHGYNGCLKRSTKLDNPPSNVPEHIQYIETLSIFGIKADYMAEFKKFLELEELPPRDQNHNYNLLTVDRKDQVKDKKLKVIRVKEGVNFKKQAARLLLAEPCPQCSSYMTQNKTIIDCRAKVQNIYAPLCRQHKRLQDTRKISRLS
jgi:hypothetical protein